MNDFMQQLRGLTLPSWLNQGDAAKLLRACVTFWSLVYNWLTWPMNQLDPLTCAEPLLNLIAFERDIVRFDGEPLSLYRKRVNYAFINAQDAGEISGFLKIFERLGIGYVELFENQEIDKWDLITVRVADKQISGKSELLSEIIRKYGRTCRRYEFESVNSVSVRIGAGWYQGDYMCYPAAHDDNNTESSANYRASL